jgi:FkbM family methyltransferase
MNHQIKKIYLFIGFIFRKIIFIIKRLIFKKQTFLFGNKLIILPKTSKFSEYKYFFKIYDEFVPILSKNLLSGSTVIDIGANVGTTLFGILKYSKNYKHKIISIEGSKYFFNYLKLNLENFPSLRKKANIQIFNTIISGKKEKLKIISDGSTGITDRANKEDRDLVIVCSLNEYLKNINPNKNILIKIDTDGYDYDVIRSGLYECNEKKPILFTELLFEDKVIKNTLKVYDDLSKMDYNYFSIFSSSGKYLTTVNSPKNIKNFIDFFNSKMIQFRNECEYFDILIYQEKHRKIVLKSIDDFKKMYV